MMKGINLAEKNGQWKGDDVGLDGLHSWVARRLAKPDRCPSFGVVRKLELSCKNHEYTRDLTGWEYLCRCCHSRVDQKILNLKDGRKPRCIECGAELMSARRHCPKCRAITRRRWWKEYNSKERRREWIREHNKEYYRLRKEKMKFAPNRALGAAEKATAA